MNVTGKRIWITGASSGIGEALVKRLDSLGAVLVLSARQELSLNRVLQACKYPQRHSIQVLDLGVSSGFSLLVTEVELRIGEIDLLINCGGLSQRSFGLDTLEDVERKIMEINYFGSVALTKAVLKPMLQRSAGGILTIGSINGKIGSPQRSAYSASKHAIMGYMDSLRAELRGSGIWISVALPGYVQSNISKNALMGNGQPFGKTDNAIASGLKINVCVDRLISVIKHEKEEAIITKLLGISMIGYWVHKISPIFYHRLLRLY
jgi:short-subunit dehydrogenase